MVRVTRFERAISTSQMWRGTSSATPGYSVLSYYTTARAKIKDFPVCGQLCGQSHFLVRFGDPAKSHKRPCYKAFRAFASQLVDGVANAPKAGALPTALHPAMKFVPYGVCAQNNTILLIFASKSRGLMSKTAARKGITLDRPMKGGQGLIV